MLLKDLPQFKKPREKLAEKGPSALTEAELLAAIIGTGRQGSDALKLATHILQAHPVSQLSLMPVRELEQIKGVGFALACRLVAAFYLGKIGSEQATPLAINKPEVVFHLAQDISSKKQEYLLGLYLDGRHHLLAKETISIGTLTSSLLHPREVFAPALKLRAASVIIVHNHPSGEVYPSNEDISATDKLVEAGEILDIPLLDHVIVSAQKWISLRELKLI
jgi:DNA repair protein RadC